MIHKAVTLLIVILGVFWSTSTSTAQTVGVVAPLNCPFDTRGLISEVECGRVTVPNDYAHPERGHMQIAYARVRAIGAEPQSDPVFYIEGGPGVPAVEHTPRLLTYFRPLLRHRDLIFIDQRGTGYSIPRVACDDFDQSIVAAVTGNEAFAAFYDEGLEIIPSCRESLEEQEINLEYFASRYTAGDIGAIAQALGYTSWNIYGVSAGTSVTLLAMRDYPEGIRSVILDSTLPPQVDAIVEGARYALQAFEDIFTECEADSFCKRAYPDLLNIYLKTVEELEFNPVHIPTTDEESGKSLDVVINGRAFNSVLFIMLSHPQARWMIPATIYDVYEGNYDGLAAYYQLQRESAGGQDFALAMAVSCNEKVPLVDPDKLEEVLTAAAELKSAGGLTPGIITLCELWGIGDSKPDNIAPVVSNIPALLLIGEYDITTPPPFTMEAAQYLSRGQVIHFPAAGHGVRNYGECPSQVMANFLADPLEMADTSCLESSSGRFSISFTPTYPLAILFGVIVTIPALWGIAYTGSAAAEIFRLRWLDLQHIRRHVTWIYCGGTLVLMLVALGVTQMENWQFDPALVMGTIFALVCGIQAAQILVSVDEPGLEILLTLPRPFFWLTLERLGLAAVYQFIAALIGVGVLAMIVPETSLPQTLSMWLVAALFLSGMACYFTVRSSNRSFGVLVVLILGLTYAVGGDMLLPAQIPNLPWAAPLDLIQPFIWIFHPFLTSSSLIDRYFIINRFVVIMTGFATLGLTIMNLRNSERLLLHGRDSSS